MASACGPGLFIREGGRILPALPEDNEVAREYPAYADKGEVRQGYRITILTRRLAVRKDDPIRIIHVCEAVAPGTLLYVMGPKAIYDEYVNGMLATAALPADEDPLAPASYDGRIISGPAIDCNYEITQYRFREPGTYLVQWRPGKFSSNTLAIKVFANEADASQEKDV
jgi:hypothetical protein